MCSRQFVFNIVASPDLIIKSRNDRLCGAFMRKHIKQLGRIFFTRIGYFLSLNIYQMNKRTGNIVYSHSRCT